MTPPQRPEDFRPQSGTGLALQDWSGPPPNASHLAFGYAADQNGTFVVYGYLFDVRQPTHARARRGGWPSATSNRWTTTARAKAPTSSPTTLSRCSAAAPSPARKIYFISNRTGTKELWVMDYDGTNQRQLTHSRSINIMPGVSPDGTLLAYTSFRTGRSPDRHSGNGQRTAARLPESRRLGELDSLLHAGRQAALFRIVARRPAADLPRRRHRSGLTRISHSNAIETEPKVNPKNPNELVFVSGRTGPQQIFRMNAEGLDVERLTDGTGEASNPSWHPDGQHILFSWTRGYAKGDWNVFLMDVASRAL